ncbi:MAG TPA: T9SS type A sorting domain-containing protein, partial [bacterium]
GASTIFEYLGSKNHKFGIKYEGNHRVIYLGMGLEAIDSDQSTNPNDVSPIRSQVLSRSLNWLNFIEHQNLVDTENMTAPRTIIARVLNSFAVSDLIQMELYWEKENDAAFTKVTMQNIGNNNFSAEIPGPGATTKIHYYIKMKNAYYEWSTPQEAPTKFYGYFVGPDQQAPSFSHIPLQSNINGEAPRQLAVGITDNSELNSSAVYVHFMSKTVEDSTLLTTAGNSNLFQGALAPVFAYGDTVKYYFSAYDKAAVPNRGQSEVFTFTVGYEDFESGLTYWNASPNGWGLDKTFYYSGLNSINDSPGIVYPINRDVSIAMNFGIDLSKTDHAALTFWTKYFLEINHDFGYVEVSNDGGLSWNKIGSAISGFNSAWKKQTVSLSGFCGSGNTNVQIRFRMISDANAGPPFMGWFIDDIQIIEGLDVTVVNRETNVVIPNKYALFQNFPNPFNPTTTIRFDLPFSGRVALKIYNLRGELVRTLIEEQLNVGSHRVMWDGNDDNGRLQSSGVYFYKLETKDFNAVRKLILLK